MYPRQAVNSRLSKFIHGHWMTWVHVFEIAYSVGYISGSYGLLIDQKPIRIKLELRICWICKFIKKQVKLRNHQK